MHLIRQRIAAFYEELSALEVFLCKRDELTSSLIPCEAESESQSDEIIYRKTTILSDLQQILKTRTLSRSKYYLDRLQQTITTIKMTDINDINLNRWKEYDDVLTDSLWLINHRDRSSVHSAEYWGNFIPQIPYQMLLRYTKAGEWVLDPFSGSGTTLIECRRLGRNGVGIELNPQVAATAEARLQQESNHYQVNTRIVIGDSTQFDYQELMRNLDIDVVQLLIMHPPYHNIIRFSDDARDLSNKLTVDDFLESFSGVVRCTYPILASGRYLVVVIGDKYEKGVWIPLGFYAMQATMREGYCLKSIIVKNYEQTKGKRDQTQLWRYRALAGGFYIFKHEYIYIFQK